MRLRASDDIYTVLDRSIWEEEDIIRVFLVWEGSHILPFEAKQDLDGLTTTESNCSASIRLNFCKLFLTTSILISLHTTYKTKIIPQ